MTCFVSSVCAVKARSFWPCVLPQSFLFRKTGCIQHIVILPRNFRLTHTTNCFILIPPCFLRKQKNSNSSWLGWVCVVNWGVRFPQVLLKVYLTLHAQHRNGDIVGYVSLFSFPNKLTWHQMALKNLYIQEPTSILPLKGLPTMGHVRTLLLDPDFTKYSQTFAGRMTIDYGLCLLRLKSPGTAFVSGSVHLRWMYKYCIDLVYPNYKVKRDSVYDHPIPFLQIYKHPKVQSVHIILGQSLHSCHVQKNWTNA